MLIEGFDFEFKDGDLLFCRGGGVNILGPLIRNAESDFDYEHVCSIWEIKGEPMVLSTGTHFKPLKGGWLYGMQPAGPYLKARNFAVGRRNDVTENEHKLGLLILQSLFDTPYATGKVLKLTVKGRTGHRVVNSIHSKPDLNPEKVFCSESEAYRIYRSKLSRVGLKEALRTINSKYPLKAEPCVHTPETLYDAPETDLVYVYERS